MSKYNINQIIDVKITSIKPYGAFVIVDDLYTGLIHISEINGKYINDTNNYFKIGDIKHVRVIGVDEEKKQLKLSMINLQKKDYKDKISKKKLPDTSLGFELFEEILPEWINEKLSEIENSK